MLFKQQEAWMGFTDVQSIGLPRQLKAGRRLRILCLYFIAHCNVIIQYRSTKFTLSKLVFKLFLCLLHVSKPRVHLQEDGCIYSYGTICVYYSIYILYHNCIWYNMVQYGIIWYNICILQYIHIIP